VVTEETLSNKLERPRIPDVCVAVGIRKKYKRLRGRKKAQTAWNRAVERRPRFFAHWAWTTYAPKVW